MKIYLRPPLLLTDEHPITSKSKPVLVDYESWKVYHPEDMIGTVSALHVVDLAVAEIGENDFLPEEIVFISRFTKGDHKSQTVHMVRMSKMKKYTDEEMEFIKRFCITGRFGSFPA
jgi:hypothetical protein